MFKNKKRSILILLALLSCFFTFCLMGNTYANAEADKSDSGFVYEETGAPAPRLFTSLSLSIDGGNGQVWATVRNDFTLFPTTVVVVVELYSSTTYYESYANMNLVSKNNIDDLDIYQTLSTSASTGGVQKYWHARVRYRINSGTWESKSTGTLTFDANGKYLGYN